MVKTIQVDFRTYVHFGLADKNLLFWTIFSTHPESKQIMENTLITAAIADVMLMLLFVFYNVRMESTEKCDAVISHFNGKFIKTPAGVPGKTYYCK